MVLAEALHTGTYVAVSPFITATTIGSLFAFTLVYAKRFQLEAAALMTSVAPATEPVVDPPGLPTSAAGEGPLDGGGSTVPVD
jgi:hypothetical protein